MNVNVAHEEPIIKDVYSLVISSDEEDEKVYSCRDGVLSLSLSKTTFNGVIRDSTLEMKHPFRCFPS